MNANSALTMTMFSASALSGKITLEKWIANVLTHYFLYLLPWDIRDKTIIKFIRNGT